MCVSDPRFIQFALGSCYAARHENPSQMCMFDKRQFDYNFATLYSVSDYIGRLATASECTSSLTQND